MLRRSSSNTSDASRCSASRASCSVRPRAFSATAVQDRLFDLYGELREHDAVQQVQQWLTLTIERDLFASDEISGFLDELERALPEPATH